MDKPFIQIENSRIGPGQPVFVISEIGTNHNGDFNRALEMIDLSAKMGANCAKFQMRRLDRVYRQKTLARSGDDLSTEYTIDLLEKFELTTEQHKELAAHCRAKGLIYMCTPWDDDSVERLESLGVGAYKVASADFTNLPLLDQLAATGKALILSTGMSDDAEIAKVVAYLNERKASFALLHCNSTYPAPIQDINLKYLSTLEEQHPIMGYSGHERGTAISLGAVARGAQIIERHFSLDRSMEGPDHAASLEYEDFKNLISGIREIEKALGTSGAKSLSQGVMMNRENLAKSLVAARPLSKGTKLTREDISVLSPGQGLSPLYINELVGKELGRDLDTEDFFFDSDLRSEFVTAGDYKFKRPWGIPVRYYDFAQFSESIKPDLWEFHLSYTDMDLKLEDFFTGTYDYDFVVHAPELFQGSHLMDMATPDKAYREQSIRETQRVIDITRDLKKYFPKTKRPLIVANVGGISMDGNIADSEKPGYYEQFFESLTKLDMDGVELIPQTMAPFPWHFGGQRYQNLFVLHDEIARHCKEQGLRMCLDVSHSKLTCTHFGIDYDEFLRTVGPYTAHLHFGDSRGVNGEGLQVGEGDIDFAAMAAALWDTCPDASFIPEIWQGHKNGGEGFWIGLDRLQAWF